MKPKISKALGASVEHWERLAKCNTRDEVKEEGIWSDDCPLCKECPDCSDCPVMERTGFIDCDGSPWTRVNRLFGYSGNVIGIELREAIQSELEFLKSLREEKTDAA